MLKPSAAPKLPQFVDATQIEDALRAHLSRRAYRLFELSGYQDGQDLSHWFQAESELLRNQWDLRESGNWLAMRAHLPDMAIDNVQIHVGPSRVIVRAWKTEKRGPQPETFLVTRLDQEVDPATASASLRDQKLTMVAKKRSPESISSLLSACLENQGVPYSPREG
jgi:HSP20 family molecular chaperone IbpA